MKYLEYTTLLLIIITQLVSINTVVVNCTATLRPTDDEEEESNSTKLGTRWAVLVAGSSGYYNYRHQADVCHAYQILKKGGLKDENIIVFMYDDIAHNEDNPTPGKIINKPHGNDVYAGVPKDYTGNATTAANLYAVLLGDKSSLSGGSGKVVKSGPNDQIFVYYADHGSPGVIGMPEGEDVYAKDLIKVLKKKHASGSYKKMVIYIEACEAGSLFQGLLSADMNIYATTASNPDESSYGTYCPGDDGSNAASKKSEPSEPDDYGTCLGDLYSVSWMEDSDEHDLRKETLKQQYDTVKTRTTESHVMQYGNLNLNKEFLSTFMGSNPKTSTLSRPNAFSSRPNGIYPRPWMSSSMRTVNQRDAALLYLHHKVKKSPEGSKEKIQAQKKLEAEISHRDQVDRSMDSIVKLLFGEKQNVENMMRRPSGKPLVDNWDCFKTLVKTYEQKCGRLSTYARKYTGAIANMCNAGVDEQRMSSVASKACA